MNPANLTSTSAQGIVEQLMLGRRRWAPDVTVTAGHFAFRDAIEVVVARGIGHACRSSAFDVTANELRGASSFDEVLRLFEQRLDYALGRIGFSPMRRRSGWAKGKWRAWLEARVSR